VLVVVSLLWRCVAADILADCLFQVRQGLLTLTFIEEDSDLGPSVACGGEKEAICLT
jgi:hypothetical protein